MTKETTQPKAVNIIRPPQPMSLSRASSQVSRSSYSSQSTQGEPRKPKVAQSAKLNHDQPFQSKPHINIYHPPSHRQSLQLFRPQDDHRASGLHRNTMDEMRPTASPYRPVQDDHARQPQQPPQLPQPYRREEEKLSQRNLQGNDLPKTAKRPIASAALTRSLTTPAFSSNTPQRHSLQPPYIRRSPSRPSVITQSSQTMDTATDPDLSETTDEDPQDSTSDVSSIQDSDDQEDDEVNDARVNRKIADLEISNRSLLAINDMLEVTVRKQASQVAKLKKQIGQAPNLELVIPPLDSAKEELSDDEWEKDELFRRLCQMTEKMIEEGQASLKFEYKGSGRVLSQYPAEDEETEKESPEAQDTIDVVSE